MAGEDNLQDIPTPMYSGATDQPSPDQPAAPAMDLSHVQLVGPTQPLPQKGSAQTSVQPQLQGPTMPLPQLQGPTTPLQGPTKPLPPVGEIRQAPQQGIFERAKSVVADSAIGHALEQGLPKVADYLGLHPKETVYSPEYEAHKKQLLSPEQLISPTSQDIGERAARGVLKTAGGFTTPENLTIMAATEGLGLAASVPAVSVLQRLISAGFGYQLIKGAIDRYPQIKQAIKDGDYPSAAELVGQSSTEGILGAQATVHATGDVSGHPGKIEVDEATKNILQGRMDARKAAIAEMVAKQGGRTYFRPASKSVAGVNIPVTAVKQEGAPAAAKVAAKFASPGEATKFMQQETRPAATQAAVSTLGQMAADKAEAHSALREGRAAAEPISGTATPSNYATVDDARAALESSARPTYQAADQIDQQERTEWEAQAKEAVTAHKTAIDAHNQQVMSAKAEGENIDTIPFDATQANMPERPKFLSELRAAEDAAWAKAKSGNAEERAEAYDKEIPKAEKDIDNWFKQHETQIPAAEYASAKDLTYRAKRLQDIAGTLRAPMLNKAVTSRTLNGIEAKVDNQAIRRGQAPGAFQRLLGQEGYQNWKEVVRTLEPTEATGPNASKIGAGDWAIGATAFGISMMSHVWGGALGLIIPLKFAQKFVLDRALFDPEFGSWWKDAFSRFKNSGGKVSPDMVDSLHSLIEKKPLTPQELKDAGFSDEEVNKNAHAAVVGGPKLKQDPAPAGPQVHAPEFSNPYPSAYEVKTGDIGWLLGRDTDVPGEVQIKAHTLNKDFQGKGIGANQLEKMAKSLSEDPSKRTLLSDDEMTDSAVGSWHRLQKKYPDAVSEYEGAGGDPRFRLDLSKLREGETKLSQAPSAVKLVAKAKRAGQSGPVDPNDTNLRFLFDDGTGMSHADRTHGEIVEEAYGKQFSNDAQLDALEKKFQDETGAIRIAENASDFLSVSVRKEPTPTQLRRLGELAKDKSVYFDVEQGDTYEHGQGSFADLQRTMDKVFADTKLSQKATAPAPAGTQANEPVSLADWDAYRGSHPITQEHIESAFPGQDVTKIDDRNFDVSLENGNTIHVQLKDVVDGGGVEVLPGNAVFGRWDKLDDGGVMQLAGIASEQTLGHETFHAAMDILPKRLQEALLNEYGDEEKAADAYGDWKGPEAKPDSLFGQIRDYFSKLYEQIFKPAQAAFREIHEGKVWQRASEKFAESNDLRPNFSVKTYPKWEKDFRAKAEKLGATPKEIEDHIKSVAPAYNMFKGLTDTPPELSGSNLFDNAWEGKHTTFEYQGFCPKNKDFNPTRKAIETEVGHFLTKQDIVGLALLMHAEAKDAPCNYCYTLSGQTAVSENLSKTAREGIWASAEHMPQTTLKLKTRPTPDKPETTQVFIPPVEERLLTDKAYRDSKIANDPELAQKVALQQFYGDKRVYANLKARKPMDEGIIPARGVMLRLSDEHIADVNSRRGFRISGNADVTPYSYMDVAQDMADFRLRGAKRYSYTKQPMYVRLVGNTGEKINMSLTMDPRSTDFIANDWSDSMNINEARALRKEFPNAGGMLMALNDNHILAGLKSDDVDMMIPFHGTRGKFPENIRDFVQDYSRENHETDIKTGKSVSGEKEIKQTEHNGDLATYLRICKERGYLPKFARFIYDNVEFNKSPNGVSSVHLKADPETGEVENPVIRKDTSKNFMKLVKDISRTDSPHEPISRNVDTKILEQVTGQMKAGSMNWEGQALPDILKTAVDRLKAGKPIYNGEMGFSYTPTAEVPASKLVQIQPAAKGGNAPQKPTQAPAQQPAAPKASAPQAPEVGILKALKGSTPELVGSRAKGTSRPDSDVDIKLPMPSQKFEASGVVDKLESIGYKVKGSSLVSPKEAASYGKEVHPGWSRIQHLENEAGQRLDIWLNADRETKMTKAPAPKVTHTFTPKAGLKKVK